MWIDPCVLIERSCPHTHKQNTEAFAEVLSTLAALLPTEPLEEEEAGKGGTGAGGSKAAAAVTTAAGKAKPAPSSSPRSAGPGRVGAA